MAKDRPRWRLEMPEAPARPPLMGEAGPWVCADCGLTYMVRTNYVMHRRDAHEDDLDGRA